MENQYLQLPNEDQLQSIYGEFNTNEGETEKGVKELIDWLQEQPHLPNVKNEFFLRNYLLRCKNDMDRTKKTIERYYVTKAKMSDVFINRDVLSESFVKCFHLAEFVPLPKLTPEGYRVSIYKINGSLDTKTITAAEFVRNSQIQGLISLNLDIHKKMILICDLEKVSLPFITLMLLSLRRLLNLSTKVTPFRFHKIYIMNAISAVSPLITLAKTFAKAEIASRIEIWTKGAKDFAEVLPADILPSDYGGSERSFDELANEWLKELQRHQDFLNDEEKEIASLDVKQKKSNKTTCASTEHISFRDLTLD